MKQTKKYGKKVDSSLKMWLKLNRAYLTFHKLAADDIRSYNLTEPQFSVIECLGHKGQMTLGELTKKHFVSGGNMTVVVDNLEKEGLVERNRSLDNRRQIFANLTPKGKKLFNQIFIKHAEYITSLASVLTEKEQLDLGMLLKKLGLGLQEKREENNNK